MTPRRILFTNNTLDRRAGTELFVRDLALELRARGHEPIAFSTILGGVAEELRAGGVTVVDRLDALTSPPDLIHAHHHIETMMALLAFPDTPAVGVCHGAAQWEETPIAHPRLVRHVAVDDACYARVCDTPGIPVASIRVILNFVDLARVPPRGPLPSRIGRAAVLNNEMNDANVLPAIREACAARDIALDVFGAASGRPLDDPGAVIGEYDLVFGKARCALEAMAAGSAVVLCAASGLGSMVTSVDFDRLRRLNFGFRTLDRQVTAESVVAELDRFDPDDAARVQHRVRAEASLTAAADQWEQVYDEALAAFAAQGGRDRDAEGRAASVYLNSISAIFKAGFATHSELIRLRAEIATARPRPASRAASE